MGVISRFIMAYAETMGVPVAGGLGRFQTRDGQIVVYQISFVMN